MKNRGGFTILETIITLTVSSMLFVTVMLAFNGRQGRVEFSQGLRDIEAYIMDVANDVQDGYYPKLTNLICATPNIDNPVISFDLSNTSPQGSNNSCIFAGKAMYFNDSDKQSIITYTLAGRKDATNTSNLYPSLIFARDVSGVLYDTSESYVLPASIRLVDSSSAYTSHLLGLFFDVSSVGASSGGVSVVVPYGIKITENTIDGLAAGVKNAFGNIPTSKDIKSLCFKSGTSNQYGTIKVQKGINGLSTSVSISDQNGSDCAVQS